MTTEQCCICLGDIKYSMTLSCGHKFCYLCIKFVNQTSGICPLCRRDITNNIDSVTMEDIEHHDEPDEFPCVKWLFSSRDGKSWWYYDDDVNEDLEQYYKQWLIRNDDEESDASEDDDHSAIDDNSSSTTERAEGYTIYVGVNEYTINFDNMTQNGNMRIRKIMRKEFANQQEKVIFDANVRGIIGIYFKKNE